MHSPRLFYLAIALIAAFGLGFTTHSLLQPESETLKEGRVTSIGGIFFKAENPTELKKWYQDNLGLQIDAYGTVFQWYQGADSTKKGFTQWSVFKSTTKYFEPSKKEFMINYRVTDMNALVEQLRKANVTICDTVESYDYGKFIHIMDPEGNKIELWEPEDVEYAKITGGLTK